MAKSYLGNDGDLVVCFKGLTMTITTEAYEPTRLLFTPGRRNEHFAE